jgi:hypothetical protein
MYRKNFNQRYIRGKEDELIVLPIIRTYFGRDIRPTTEKTDRYDFYYDNYKYELKSRTNNFNAYPSTMIAVDKLDVNVILLFKFTDDKLAFIEYDKDKFEKYEKKLFTKYVVPKEHIYIPINDLTLISESNHIDE